MQKKKILIVEDEKELVKLIAYHMAIAGYAVVSAKDGLEALELTKTEKPDLIILDILLPKIDGWEVCRRLKGNQRTSNIPVIILSALSATNDKLKGFDLGSDDYITKPFSPRELVVRVKRVLARSEIRIPVLPKVIKIGSLEINTEDISVKRNKQEVLLTGREKDMLRFFLNNPERVLTHSQILDKVWGEEKIVEYGNIDVHIRHLREKLEKDPENPRLIRTIKGEGYKFEPD